MGQVSTDRIDAKIAELLTEAEGLREKEKRASGYRDAGMDEYIAIGKRVFAISVLEEFLDDE